MDLSKTAPSIEFEAVQSELHQTRISYALQTDEMVKSTLDYRIFCLEKRLQSILARLEVESSSIELNWSDSLSSLSVSYRDLVDLAIRNADFHSALLAIGNVEHLPEFSDPNSQSILHLERACILQQMGNTKKALRELRNYEYLSTSSEHKPRAFVCRGKVVAQHYRDGKYLGEYINEVEPFLPESALASLIWRQGVLLESTDRQSAAKARRRHSEIDTHLTYQQAHSKWCASFSIIERANRTDGARSQIDLVPELLWNSFNLYEECTDFAHAEKCIASNLLLLGLVEKIRGRTKNYYTYTMASRSLMKMIGVTPQVEAMAEIMAQVGQSHPETKSLVFDSVPSSSYSNSGKIRDASFEVEDIMTGIDSSDRRGLVINFYKELRNSLN